MWGYAIFALMIGLSVTFAYAAASRVFDDRRTKLERGMHAVFAFVIVVINTMELQAKILRWLVT